VLLFYLEKRGIEPEQRIDYLMPLLDLQKSMVYNLLHGEGFDQISRCRLLMQGLMIYPPLLGLDAKYAPIEQHPSWWRACGFPFNADAQGYPMIGEVIAYLRTQRTQTGEGGRVKVWSQEALGNATGFKKETIYRMERDRNPLILESMSRRAIVASALGTLAGENEPTLFRLFGLDPQAYRVPVTAASSRFSVHFSLPKLTDEILQGYHRQQKAFFMEYSTHHAQNRVGEVREWTKLFPGLMQEAKTTAQRVSLLALQSRNHRLLACIAREQCKEEHILFHTNKAMKLAEQAMTLPNPKLGGDQHFLVTTQELFTSALLTAAMASYELGEYNSAQQHADQALALLPTVQSSQMKRQILADAGLIHAYRAENWKDQQQAFSYFKLAASGLDPHQPDEPDANYVRCGKGMLYLRKGMALCAPNMKGASAEKVSDILDAAQRLTDPELVRRHVIIEVFLALAHFEAFEYQQATEVALSALEKSRLIWSRLSRNRLEGLYEQLLHTPFRDKPDFSRLGWKLRLWDYEMNEARFMKITTMRPGLDAQSQ
jgi:hypothetical protein